MNYVEYLTHPKDVLDAICYTHYGVEGHTETVLAANPHIVDYPAHLPEGIVIRFPTLRAAALPVAQTVSLWD